MVAKQRKQKNKPAGTSQSRLSLTVRKLYIAAVEVGPHNKTNTQKGLVRLSNQQRDIKTTGSH